MTRPSRTLLSTLLIGLALATASSTAFGQWVWKDEGGHVVASDQPPPMNVPPGSILKQPRPRSGARAPANAPAADANVAKTDAPKSLADRELESKQHAKEAAEAAKKSDEDAARAKALKDNCSAVRGNLAALQAGGRASRFNEKGEKVYIDDADRQSEINKQQAQVSQYCKS